MWLKKGLRGLWWGLGRVGSALAPATLLTTVSVGLNFSRHNNVLSLELKNVQVDWKAALGSLPPNTNGQVIVVVMELMEGGELFYHIVQGQSKRLSEAEAREVAVQLAEALDDLHSAGVVHRDIKPENVLLAGTDELKLKLCDFGFASMGEPKGYECTVVCTSSILFGPRSLRLLKSSVTRRFRPGAHSAHPRRPEVQRICPTDVGD